MLALVAKLTPLRKVVGTLVKKVDLAIGTTRPKNILLDRLPNPDHLDKLIVVIQLAFPFLGRDDLDDAGLHAILVDFLHLEEAQMD